jgi:hypothetical protein
MRIAKFPPLIPLVWGTFTNAVEMGVYLRYQKEDSPASILARVRCDVSFRTFLAGLRALFIKQSLCSFALVCCVLCELCVGFDSRMLRVLRHCGVEGIAPS